MSKTILVVYWHPNTDDTMRIAIYRHLHCLDLIEDNKILYLNTFFNSINLGKFLHFDAIIFHTTVLCLRWSPSDYSRWIKQYRWLYELDCIKIAIPQDEYDHSQVLDKWLDDLNVSTIFTNFDERFRSVLYPIMELKADFYYCFTGYIDALNNLTDKKLLPIKERNLDIVYRASNLPYWFGSHGQLKHEIAGIVQKAASEQGLTTDISTKPIDTITGENWYRFMASGRATIGTESGSSVLDESGNIQNTIKAILEQNPSASFDEVSEKMPDGWDSFQFFALSPRHFEAILTKTCQILVEGDYGGILKAHQHYIPLKRDFSNLDEVLTKLKDTDYVQKIVDCAYEEIYLSKKYTYSNFAQQLLAVIDTKLTVSEYKTTLNQNVLWQIFTLYFSITRSFWYIRQTLFHKLVVPTVTGLKSLMPVIFDKN